MFKNQKGINNSFYGRHHNEETLTKLKDKMSGNKFYYNINTLEIKRSKVDLTSDEWKPGRGPARTASNNKIWHKYCCEDLSKIENYDIMMSEPHNNREWCIHHRFEIIDGIEVETKKSLIENGLYYDRPANELIFMRTKEHNKMHSSGRTASEETKAKMRASWRKRGPMSAETKEKLRKANLGIKRGHWYNNGKESKIFNENEVPDGWLKGRIVKERDISEQEHTKRSDSAKNRTDYHSFKLTDQQKQNLSNAKKEFYGSIR